ncbi:MAG TPA: cell division protein FtsQ/DivIB [Candidatus Sumerlaeota bacterium]|nr:cell division protein FtsQ/DivIB [Candidatus Sumerlaeota bacterium]
MSRKRTEQEKTILRDEIYVRLRRIFSWTLRILTILFALSLAMFLGWRLHFFLLRSSYFRLTSVETPGLDEDLRNDLLAFTELNDLKKKEYNLLKYRTSWFHDKIARMPLVRAVQVHKVYPGTLKVMAYPRKPAILVAGNGLYLADSEGMIMGPLRPSKQAEYNFPIITGLPETEVRVGHVIEQEAFFKALDIQSAMKRHSGRLYDSLSELNINGRSEITAVFEKGTEVRFGRRDPLNRLPELDAFLARYSPGRDGLARYKYLDMRFQKQIVYLTREENRDN